MNLHYLRKFPKDSGAIRPHARFVNATKTDLYRDWAWSKGQYGVIAPIPKPVVRYKVVYTPRHGVYKGKKVSCMARGQFCLTYCVNRWARAEFGGLLVFRRLKEAKEFMLGTSMPYKIFRCECRYQVQLPRYALDLFNLSFSNTSSAKVARYLWNNPTADRTTIYGDTEAVCALWPLGTEAWKEIKLTKLVCNPMTVSK